MIKEKGEGGGDKKNFWKGEKKRKRRKKNDCEGMRRKKWKNSE